MAITPYTRPTSFDDKNMDWGNPNPCMADYVMALKLALIERGVPETFLVDIQPYFLCSDVIRLIEGTIRSICPHFVRDDLDDNDYESWDDYPKKWTWEDLKKVVLSERNEQDAIWHGSFSASNEAAQYISFLKDAICHLCVVRVELVSNEYSTFGDSRAHHSGLNAVYAAINSREDAGPYEHEGITLSSHSRSGAMGGRAITAGYVDDIWYHGQCDAISHEIVRIKTDYVDTGYLTIKSFASIGDDAMFLSLFDSNLCVNELNLSGSGLLEGWNSDEEIVQNGELLNPFHVGNASVFPIPSADPGVDTSTNPYGQGYIVSGYNVETRAVFRPNFDFR